ncbi:MAG: hypothetical protein M0D55_00225 [Elusimicrobiota bacterium]|nr:MAG: hypothetical protein M0D55_00225 [Elusimicrobiota bacterium]
MLRRMTETPEYQRLDALYENKKDRPGWKDTDEGKGVIAARERLQAAALSAKIETGEGGVKKVVYTQGGKKYTLDGFVPDAVASDAATRNDVAGMIARMIVGDEQGDPKFNALIASIKGEIPDPAIAPGESAVARTVPPALKSVKDGAAGCDKPADLINNDHETYAARQRAKAAEVTAENKRRRDAIKAQEGAQLAAAQQVCDQEMAAAQSITKKSDFEADDSLRARKAAAAAKAKTDCDARRAVIIDAAKAQLAARDEAEKTTNAGAVIRAADAEVNASFRIAVDASVDTLRREYSDPKSSRHASLIRGAELRGTSTELVGFVAYWFNRQWPAGEGRKGAIDKCAADMGLGATIAGKSNPDYANPENPSKVADKCGIHDALVAYVKSQKGTIH